MKNKYIFWLLGGFVFGGVMVLTVNYSFSLIDQPSTSKMLAGILLLFSVVGVCVFAFNLALKWAKGKDVLADESKSKSDVTTKEKY